MSQTDDFFASLKKASDYSSALSRLMGSRPKWGEMQVPRDLNGAVAFFENMRIEAQTTLKKVSDLRDALSPYLGRLAVELEDACAMDRESPLTAKILSDLHMEIAIAQAVQGTIEKLVLALHVQYQDAGELKRAVINCQDVAKVFAGEHPMLGLQLAKK